MEKISKFKLRIKLLKYAKYGFFLAAIPSVVLVIFRCPYTVPFLACDLCAVLDCPSRHYRKPILVGLLGYVAVTKSDFCGRVCPLGTLHDIFTKIRLTISKKSFKISPELKLIFELLKYTIFAFVIVALLNGNPRFYTPIQAGNLLNSIWISIVAGGDAYLGRLLLVLGAISIGIILPRFWCRYACPYGTTIQLTKKGITKIKQHKCSNCGKHDTN
ncbi:conserved hypothetical protein [Methanococcus vannielii SB]|uniref:4Fe-4S ferredoxin-type domain-containing protein n=1 Tax=Methanococcus vannielii (strain ATCC 35089 / DSM 1224 / JCM 13029 / OCM 148 / SB) TaxID=406327 RepID=A6UNY7_METVS|nr:4Fe-4S binding protein [Methanococcus vannielii]ABR54209.1 conserved hypothetical protein [Methanococcus vannielii SB]